MREKRQTVTIWNLDTTDPNGELVANDTIYDEVGGDIFVMYILLLPKSIIKRNNFGCFW